MIERILFIYFACVIIRSIKTVQKINEILGHKIVTAFTIGLDTILFLFVFKNLLSGDLTIWLILAMASGYISGYYLGAFIEDRMALGKVMVTIKIAKENAPKLAKKLKEGGFIFIQSKRFYSHRGKLRKLFQGLVYRKELPKLKKVTKEFKVLGIVENVKSTFGKEMFSSEEYLKFQDSSK
ncbi:hypothetical protein C0585_07140 [Candidatus Woesearchaeota archaeon]|nr:MAG: hypothetical protein C0585_07140 [Candidatus Woesearchaeota archaeon]